MPEVDYDQLEKAWQSAQRGVPISLIDLSQPYSVEALIRAFSQQRETLASLLAPLTDAQVQFKPATAEFSIGEVVSHMVAAQGGVYNALLDLSHIVMPFISHVPNGPGAGARNSLGASALREELRSATQDMVDLIRQVARDEAPAIREYPRFGRMSPKSWMLFQIYHDHDHVLQAQAVSRLPTFPAERTLESDRT